ncbi:MAG: hypothetical protein QXJ27_02195, partial [Thermoplasmata archaeon]
MIMVTGKNNTIYTSEVYHYETYIVEQNWTYWVCIGNVSAAIGSHELECALPRGILQDIGNRSVIRFATKNWFEAGDWSDSALITNLLLRGLGYTFTKTATSSSVSPGGVITYIITFTVTSGVQTITIWDTIPEYCTYLNSTPPSGQSGFTYFWNYSNLVPPAVITIYLNVTVEANTPEGTQITNTANISFYKGNTIYTDRASASVYVPEINMGYVGSILFSTLFLFRRRFC